MQGILKRSVVVFRLLLCVLVWWLNSAYALAQNNNGDTAVKSVSTGVSVEDYLGRKVTLKQPAKRIIALAPHVVENLFSAGAGEFVVGAVDYCDYPEQAKHIPRVGAISAYSVESILALKPDLVIVWISSRGGQIMEQLERLGLTTYANDPRTLDDVARSVRDYSILAGTQKVGAQAAKNYEKNLSRLRNIYSHTKPVSVLYQVWYEPLQTLNDKHIISDVIRMCGGVNSFGDAPTLAPKINIESVLERNPAAIIASGMSEARPDWLDNWKKWPSLQAVKNSHLYFIPPDIIQRHTVRILDGAELMCEHLQSTRAVLYDH